MEVASLNNTCVTRTSTAETIVTRWTVRSQSAQKQEPSSVGLANAFSLKGDATENTIAGMAVMNSIAMSILNIQVSQNHVLQ